MRYITLNNGNNIPVLGLGTYKNTAQQSVCTAIETAYSKGIRLIDTAEIYGNERQIGNALEELKLDRKELFITSKIWNSEHGFDTAMRSFERSLKNLRTNYLDLYLIHWPVAGKFAETWKALEKLYEQGLVKNIGVSNFHEHHLKELFKTAKIIPAVNQIELHAYLTQKELVEFCKRNQIAIESWSPIAKGKIIKDKELIRIADAHKKTAVQVALRWHLQQDFIAIPKSENSKHIEEFSKIFDFELTDYEMQKISELDKHLRVGPNPDSFKF